MRRGACVAILSVTVHAEYLVRQQYTNTTAAESVFITTSIASKRSVRVHLCWLQAVLSQRCHCRGGRKELVLVGEGKIKRLHTHVDHYHFYVLMD